MTQQKPGSNFNDLIAAAHGEAADQAQKTAELAAQVPKVSKAKPVLAMVLFLAFVAIAAVQYPKFEEPFGAPTASSEADVAKADLSAIAMVVEEYRSSKGQYPATMNELDLPDTMADYLRDHAVSYRLSGNAYTLEVNLPKSRVVYDGETGIANAR